MSGGATPNRDAQTRDMEVAILGKRVAEVKHLLYWHPWGHDKRIDFMIICFFKRSPQILSERKLGLKDTGGPCGYATAADENPYYDVDAGGWWPLVVRAYEEGQ